MVVFSSWRRSQPACWRRSAQRQQRRINDTGAHGSTDRAHRPLHDGEERGTGVLHQVPSVGYLDGVRATLGGSLDVACATIAGDDADRGVRGEPGGDCCCLAIRQDVDDATLFQIADDRAVAVAALPGPVIDPHHPWCRIGSSGVAADHAE